MSVIPVCFRGSQDLYHPALGLFFFDHIFLWLSMVQDFLRNLARSKNPVEKRLGYFYYYYLLTIVKHTLPKFEQPYKQHKTKHSIFFKWQNLVINMN